MAPGRALGDGALSLQLRAPIPGARSHAIRFEVRLALGAVEHVVARDVHRPGADPGRGPGHVTRAGPVDRHGAVILGLGPVHVGPRGTVDDGVGPELGEGPLDVPGAGYVELAAGQRDRLVAGRLGRRGHVSAKHPRAARDQDPHRGSRVDGPPRLGVRGGAVLELWGPGYADVEPRLR